MSIITSVFPPCPTNTYKHIVKITNGWFQMPSTTGCAHCWCNTLAPWVHFRIFHALTSRLCCISWLAILALDSCSGYCLLQVLLSFLKTFLRCNFVYYRSDRAQLSVSLYETSCQTFSNVLLILRFFSSFFTRKLRAALSDRYFCTAYVYILVALWFHTVIHNRDVPDYLSLLLVAKLGRAYSRAESLDLGDVLCSVRQHCEAWCKLDEVVQASGNKQSLAAGLLISPCKFTLLRMPIWSYCISMRKMLVFLPLKLMLG